MILNAQPPVDGKWRAPQPCEVVSCNVYLVRHLRPEQVLASTSLAQHGVFSRRQALAAGFGIEAIRYRVSCGRWRRVLPEVYTEAATPLTWHSKQMAACLWAGDGSAASHRAAARLWRLNGFATARLELSTVGRRRPIDLGFRAHRVDRFILNEIVYVDGIPTTSVRRTLLDLAGLKVKYTSSALDQSLRLGMTSLPEMWALYEQEWTRGRRGIAILRGMLVERSDGQAPTHSEMETMMERLIRRGRLAKPRRQWPVTIPTGPIYLDFAYPHRSLDIECDSYAWHMDREAFERDRRRDAELQRLGWTVLRFTWSQLKWQGDWVIDQIRHHLDKPDSLREQRRVVPDRSP